jgi:hypothetical protein
MQHRSFDFIDGGGVGTYYVGATEVFDFLCGQIVDTSCAICRCHRTLSAPPHYVGTTEVLNFWVEGLYHRSFDFLGEKTVSMAEAFIFWVGKM